jgi:hypothetical protein
VLSFLVGGAMGQLVAGDPGRPVIWERRRTCACRAWQLVQTDSRLCRRAGFSRQPGSATTFTDMTPYTSKGGHHVQRITPQEAESYYSNA